MTDTPLYQARAWTQAELTNLDNGITGPITAQIHELFGRVEALENQLMVVNDRLEEVRGSGPAPEGLILGLGSRIHSLETRMNDLRTDAIDPMGIIPDLQTETLALTQRLNGIQAGNILQQQRNEVNQPEEFAGERSKFDTFISQLRLYFSAKGNMYPNDKKRCIYILSRIKKPGYELIKPIADSLDTANELPEVNNINLLYKYMEARFGPHDRKGDAERQLRTHKLNSYKDIETYNAEFQRLAAMTEWSDGALASQYELGLTAEVKRYMVSIIPRAQTVTEFMTQASTICKNLQQMRDLMSTTTYYYPTHYLLPTTLPTTTLAITTSYYYPPPITTYYKPCKVIFHIV